MTNAIQTENLVEGSLSESWSLFNDDVVLYVIASLLVLVVSVLSIGSLLTTPFSSIVMTLAYRRLRGAESGLG